jgi:hypothetical protein
MRDILAIRACRAMMCTTRSPWVRGRRGPMTPNWHCAGLSLLQTWALLTKSYAPIIQRKNTTPSTMFNTNIRCLSIVSLLFDLCNPDLLFHLQKPDPWRRHGQYVSQLIISPYKLNFNPALCSTSRHKVIPGSNMLASSMVDWILDQINGRFVINLQH